MAKVSLRSYNHEIEGMIEQGQRLDEAIAHCHHILKTFPKNIETYRLLGKSYLEAKRYNEAVDIFQRVLVSVPDDFVSHVGMSIIADEQAKLDDAIWHMERAFEVQPSNAAIQAELQRLFGRRDGVEPPKIRLTRGALAHMYVQGELYTQAVSEIRAVLGNDSGRTDMQVLLAIAYYRNGQKPEANDICLQLLKRFPYCLDANRIMVEILPASQAPESTQVYRRRVDELDPYAAFTQESIFDSAQVADAAVGLERLEYTGQAVEVGTNWAGSQGISLTSDATAAASTSDQPDWLKAGSSAPPAPAPAPEAAPQDQEPIPDFLKQAGWGASAAPPTEGPSAFVGSEETARPAAAQADLPDWVKALAPAESTEPSPEPAAMPSDTPDWLKGLGAQESPSAPPPSVAAAAPKGDSDWLRSLGGDQPLQEEAPAADVPDWLKNLDQTPAAPAAPTKVTPPPSTPTPAPAPPSPPAAEPVSAPAPADALGNLGTSVQEQDDAMAWLESLAAKHGAKPEELVTDPSARTDVAPEWVDKAKQLGGPTPPPVQPAAPTGMDETGAWLKNLEASEAETLVSRKQAPQPVQGDLTDWRSGLEEHDHFAAEEPGKEEEPILGSDSAPDWLKQPDTSPALAPGPGDAIPEWLRQASKEEVEPAIDAPQEFSSETSSPSSIPDWLAGLDKEEQQEITAPSSSDTEIPTWLQGEAKPRATARTEPTDWQPIESKPVAAPPPVRETSLPVEEPAAPPPPQPKPRAEKKEPAPPKPVEPTGPPKVGEVPLVQARAELGRGNIAAALDVYGKLIRKAKSLDEIIRDLRDALYRYPVEVPIWQALGDAYMRANRLQEALDAYTKAEELLR